MPKSKERSYRELQQLQLAPSAYNGGPGVIEYVMRRRLSVQLNQEQAAALWTEVAAKLDSIGLSSTVVEVNESVQGSLDTLPRDDVLEAISQLFTQMSWPANMASREESDTFLTRAVATIQARGYASL